jgi:hypothetical protein
VLEEIVRVESTHSRSTMGIDEAFQLLHRLLAQMPHDMMRGLSHQQLLDGLATACWRRLSPSSDDLRLAIPYTQLYHGIVESIREREAAIETLESTLRETIQHTNELPRLIRAHETEIATTIASFASLAAASLDCAVQRNRPHFGKQLLKSRIDPKLLADNVRARIATLKRRKDLRMWACDALRGQINDYMIRASELKKEIAHVIGEVKKEELTYKVQAVRMEEALTSTAGSPKGRSNAMMSGVATKGLECGAANASTPRTLSVSSLHDRLSLAHEKRQELQAAIETRRSLVRQRTEEIFDVRNEVKTLQATKDDLLAQAEALEEAMVHLRRACTPRPNWEELQRAVTVTTAVDHLGRQARASFSFQSRNRRGLRGELPPSEQDSDEMGTANKMQRILTSTWTTIEKVEALAGELCRIRDKYHGGNELAAERTKLAQLQKDIQQTLEQLSCIRSVASRGGVGATKAM